MAGSAGSARRPPLYALTDPAPTLRGLAHLPLLTYPTLVSRNPPRTDTCLTCTPPPPLLQVLYTGIVIYAPALILNQGLALGGQGRVAERGQGLIGWMQVGTEEAPGETWEGRLLLESEGPKALGPGLHSTWQPNWGLLAVTGLDIWASLLSTGAICTFYTTVVSDFPGPTLCPMHPGWGPWAGCPLPTFFSS